MKSYYGKRSTLNRKFSETQYYKLIFAITKEKKTLSVFHLRAASQLLRASSPLSSVLGAICSTDLADLLLVHNTKEEGRKIDHRE